jgi:hypothetical protein
MALLRDHVSEDVDTGLPITEGVRSANLIDRTPIGAPGVSTIKTSELRALIGDGEHSASGELPLLLSTNCSTCLRVAIPGTNLCSRRVSKRSAGRCETSSLQSPGRPLGARRSDATRDNFLLERSFLGCP